MGTHIRIEVDPHTTIDGWLERPQGTPRAGLVVIQEIFGVNAHMRDVTAHYARHGYLALAPALFDPVQPGLELAYDADGMAQGKALAAEVGVEQAVKLVGAAARALRAEGIESVGVVGFCWGGTIAYLSDTRLGLPAVSYYGARTTNYLDETLRAPMQFHFGAEDASTPATDIERTRQAQPNAETFVYAGAGHAFNRKGDASHYSAEAAREADARTLRFFEKNL